MKEAFGLRVPETLQDIVHPNRCALLLYDMQAGIVPQISSGREVQDRCLELLTVAWRAGMRVFHTPPLSTLVRFHYDLIVCGSGGAGSVIARRLVEDKEVSVLLLEAGDDDQTDSVSIAAQWPRNLRSKRSWNYTSEPNQNLIGRQFPIDAGKTLGAGSSINVMTRARGRKSDWDFFAAEANDPEWGTNL